MSAAAPDEARLTGGKQKSIFAVSILVKLTR
jgi:hypothetical protein